MYASVDLLVLLYFLSMASSSDMHIQPRNLQHFIQYLSIVVWVLSLAIGF
jgi:hypothetical protein